MGRGWNIGSGWVATQVRLAPHEVSMGPRGGRNCVVIAQFPVHAGVDLLLAYNGLRGKPLCERSPA